MLLKSPARILLFREQSEAKPCMEIGTAIHAALLEPERFKADYVLLKDVKDVVLANIKL